MKKAIYLVLIAMIASVLFSACGKHTHKWKEATCQEPRTCKECGKTEGQKSSEHTWIDATCTEPKTCEVCGLTEGQPLKHRSSGWETEVEATLSVDGVNVKRCVECGEELDSEEVVKHIEVRDGSFNFTADEFIEYLELKTNYKIGRGEVYDEGRQTLTNYIAADDKDLPFEVNIITEGRYASDPVEAVLIDITAEKDSYPKAILEKLVAKLETERGRGNVYSNSGKKYPDVEELADRTEPYTYFESKNFKVETQVKEHFLVCISKEDVGLENTAEFVDSILHIPFYLDINFNKNIIFDKYGVEVWVNDELIATLDHGEDFTKLLTVPRGDYTLKFVSLKDSAVTQEESVHINGPTTIRCKIQTHSSEIEFKEYEVLNNVDSALILMPYVVGMTLDQAEEALKACGFIDIRNDIGAWFYSKSDYQVIGQKPEAGTANEYKSVILLSCITLENAQNADNYKPEPTPTVTPEPEKEEESQYEKAFVREMSNYDIYYIFDADTNTVYNIYTGDTSVMEGSYTGDFDGTIVIDWTREGYSEKFVIDKDGRATLVDHMGEKWEYEECSVNKAEEALNEILKKKS